MNNSYLRAAVRRFTREKTISLVKIIGLALGLAVFIVCFQASYLGFHYDEFHANAGRLYGVVQVQPTGREGDKHLALTPGPLAWAMKNEFPEIEDGVRFVPASRTIVRYNEKKFYEDGILYVDRNFLSLFSFALVSGNPEQVFSRPDSIVLTETAARKYFGEADPLGQRLSVSAERDVAVTGVVRDVPFDSSLRFDFLLPLEALSADLLQDWKSSPFASFILLREGARPERLEEKFPAFIQAHLSGFPDPPRRLYLLPLTGFFHRPRTVLSYLNWNSPAELYIALFGGILFLSIVCINYASLSIASAVSRAREVGVRKVMGATGGQLLGQFLGESVLMAVVSLALALPIFSILQHFYISLFGLQPTATITIWNSPFLILSIACVTLLTGILTGLYPALLFSRFQPATIFRESRPAGGRSGRVRKVLMVVQFGLSIFFILFSLTAQGQYKYLLNKDFGFDRKNVLVIPTSQEVLPRTDPLKASLKSLSGVSNVTSASFLPVKTSNERSVVPEGLGREEALAMDVLDVGYDFTEALGIRVTQGRSFSRDYAAGTELIINQTALKQLGWTQPLGKRLTLGEESGAVVGVVRDFQFRNMITQTPPTVLVLKPEQSGYLFVRLDPAHTAASLLPLIKDRWDALAPGIPLESFLLEHYFADAYADINNAGQMMRAVGVGSILFSCLGMLGLVSFVLSKRTKEIGIRKTMGASAGLIFNRLMREFVLLVVLANLIAQPLAYILLTKFMQTGYAFSADISLAGFLLVAALSILVTGLVIFHQVSKAARQNPVRSLRYE